MEMARSGSRGSTRRRRERSDSVGTGESGGSGGGGGDAGGGGGARGDLMMSRILVRAGETFKFKYPVAASSSPTSSPAGTQGGAVVDRKLSARLLYGRGLPAFLSYAIAPASASSTPASNRSPGKNGRRDRERDRDRTEVEFWGTPRAADVGEIVVGIFDDGSEGGGEGGGGGERCVGRLVVEVVAKG